MAVEPKYQFRLAFAAGQHRVVQLTHGVVSLGCIDFAPLFQFR